MNYAEPPLAINQVQNETLVQDALRNHRRTIWATTDELALGAFGYQATGHSRYFFRGITSALLHALAAKKRTAWKMTKDGLRWKTTIPQD